MASTSAHVKIEKKIVIGLLASKLDRLIIKLLLKVIFAHYMLILYRNTKRRLNIENIYSMI